MCLRCSVSVNYENEGSSLHFSPSLSIWQFSFRIACLGRCVLPVLREDSRIQVKFLQESVSVFPLSHLKLFT